ncbi:MAG TPA: hypothetical protein VMY35_19015 [Phycisphaerae bacterium]|nr:hypothetical protein [Phycisphaerae bacterium]
MKVATDLVQTILLGYLKRYAWGRAAARTQGRIGLDLRHLGLDVTTRDVRDALAALALAGAPVGTTAANPAGAFVCESREDYLLAYRNLYVRVRRQARRCRRFKETARAALSGQTVFDFGEADEQYHDLANAPLLAACGSAEGTVR